MRDKVTNADGHHVMHSKDEVCNVDDNVMGVEGRNYVGKHKTHPNL